MSTFGYGFLADWKLWLHLSTFVNAWFLYEVSDTLADTLCQHCHPWNGCILLSENIWCERDTGYPNVPLHPQVCSACLCRYFFAKVSPALQTSNTGLKIFLKRGWAYSTRKPCHCQQHAWKASGNGNKRLTGNQKEEKERLTDEAKHWCFIRKPFLFLFAEVPLLPQT